MSLFPPKRIKEKQKSHEEDNVKRVHSIDYNWLK